MSEVIQFSKADLMTYRDLEILIVSDRPVEKAQLIASTLKNYLFINKKELYTYDLEHVLYNMREYKPSYINSIIAIFIDKSFNELDFSSRELLKNNYKKTYDKIFLKDTINKYVDLVETFITNNDVSFQSNQLFEIHFKNGYYDFRANEFKKRIYGQHYIRSYINRDYLKPNKDDIDMVMKDISKIYPRQDDRDYLLMTFGQAFSGVSTEEQSMLFLLGTGSAGKSTIIEMCYLAFGDCYVNSLQDGFFTENFKSRDKVVNSYLINPCYRLTHINEMKDTKFDKSFFKDFCDGAVKSVSLFKDGSNNFRHFSKVIFTANTFPNIVIDTGTERRIDSYTHTSKFVDHSSEVDESKNIFLKDKDLLRKMALNNSYLNAFSTIVFTYGYNWLNNIKRFKQTDNFRQSKTAIISSNDTIQDFIDKQITITNDDNDRIGRDEMYEVFKTLNQKSYITPTQLLNSLKDKGIKYQADYRINKIKGCYVGITFDGKKSTVSTEDAHLTTIDKQATEIKELKAKIQEMEEAKARLEAQIEILKSNPYDDFNARLDALMKKFDAIPSPPAEPAPKQAESFMDKVNRLIYDAPSPKPSSPITPPEPYYSSDSEESDDDETEEEDEEPEDIPDNDMEGLLDLWLSL
jgi:hypothetical protein